jgi:hypothetical protein
MTPEPQDPLDTTLAIIGLITAVVLLVYSLKLII